MHPPEKSCVFSGTRVQSSASALSCYLHVVEFTLLVHSAHMGLHIHHFCLAPGHFITPKRSPTVLVSPPFILFSYPSRQPLPSVDLSVVNTFPK